MIKYDEDWVSRVYKTYSDDDLKDEYSVCTAMYEIDKVENSLFIEMVDLVHTSLLEECASRFVSNCSTKNVIYLKQS